jgi:hypothetical protein
MVTLPEEATASLLSTLTIIVSLWPTKKKEKNAKFPVFYQVRSRFLRGKGGGKEEGFSISPFFRRLL